MKEDTDRPSVPDERREVLAELLANWLGELSWKVSPTREEGLLRFSIVGLVLPLQSILAKSDFTLEDIDAATMALVISTIVYRVSDNGGTVISSSWSYRLGECAIVAEVRVGLDTVCI